MHWLFGTIYQIKKPHGTSFYRRFSTYLFHKNVSLSNTLVLLIFEVVAEPVKTLKLELEGFWFKAN